MISMKMILSKERIITKILEEKELILNSLIIKYLFRIKLLHSLEMKKSYSELLLTLFRRILNILDTTILQNSTKDVCSMAANNPQ